MRITKHTVWAIGLSLSILLAMLSPLLSSGQEDDFPLTTYPMYSGAMGKTSRIRTILGITPSGGQETLSPTLIAGDPSVILAVRTAAAARRPADKLALCSRVAERVAADPERSARYTELVFLTERYDAPAFFLGATEPAATKVHARCPVPH